MARRGRRGWWPFGLFHLHVQGASSQADTHANPIRQRKNQPQTGGDFLSQSVSDTRLRNVRERQDGEISLFPHNPGQAISAVESSVDEL